MARDFTIINNDVKKRDVYAAALLPINDNYAPVLSGYVLITNDDNTFVGTVYGPQSLQIKGPISLRQTSEPYSLTTNSDK